MAVLPTGIGPVTGGYQIERSLRFNSADSAYLNRTPASTTNRRTWTWSGWVKKSALGGTQALFTATIASPTTDSNLTSFGFNSSDRISIGGGLTTFLETSQVFRDLSAWYHLVCAVDTTQATADNRVRFYVNGSEITAFASRSNPTQNLDTAVNSTVQHNISSGQPWQARYFNGYMTEINFIDGQALTPSSFGETDSATGVWKPKAYTGTYGTNGFYLKFADNSGTTSTTLGKDSSGNGNNWTPNNFSVTAGSGNDSLVDSPTAYGTDTGVGGEVRGNYATFNALTTTGNTLTNGNLDAAAAAAAWRGSFSTIGISSGKWYMEFTIVGGTYARQIIGIALNSAVNSASFYGYGYMGGSQVMGRSVGAIPVDYSSGTLTSLSPTTDFDNGDVVGLCIDADAGKLWVFKNNTIIEGTVNGTANVTWTANSLVFPVASMYSGDSVYANFGQRPFAYTAPSGFKALCTQNLPTPTIGATSTTQANDYFDTVLYTGTSATQNITSLGFQPDWVWIKIRNQAYSHNTYDAVRGANKRLRQNQTGAEATVTDQLMSFNSNGFTLGADSGAEVNSSGNTFVAWNWKANGAGSTNTAGTITSTVSANTTSGFSIVTYTGTGANATVGHGLGVAPSMIIVKNRTDGTRDWLVYHASIGNTAAVFLNLTNASTALSAYWNNTSPTSSVFSLGNSSAGNGSTNSLVAYCFAPVAGYSAFGSFVGNANADGPMVYLGFRPRWILIKNASALGDWFLYDTARNTYNISDNRLKANLSDAEGTGGSYGPDILSNGFKMRSNFGELNGSGNTIIYAAFAETAFRYSLAR